jgi:outer membrane murein-binding lipoprotein Lpp
MEPAAASAVPATTARTVVVQAGGALRALASKLEELAEAKWRAQQERIRLEGTSGEDRSAEVDQISTDLRAVQQQMDGLSGKIEQHKNQLRTLDSELPQHKANYELDILPRHEWRGFPLQDGHARPHQLALTYSVRYLPFGFH